MFAEMAGLILFLVLYSVFIVGSQAAATGKTGSSAQSIESSAGEVMPKADNASIETLALSSSE
jgi:hypothetical protein